MYIIMLLLVVNKSMLCMVETNHDQLHDDGDIELEVCTS